VWLLALFAYLPALTAKPGRMPTDTKLYLYLDPGRLITDAPFTWDTRQFAGWVPHQTIAYLWPSGPWFWTFDQFGVPDWVAHRLWIGTIVFLGGLGVRWAARHLGLSATGATVAGLVYALSPYILPYISRTSVMLLPWAGVGWLVGLTIRVALRRTRWRDAALFALVVLTIGAVNATALALVAPAPVLWLLHAAWARSITWRRALVTAAQFGALSLAVSMWWIVMLVVQGRHGADVLAFSETLEAVSLTSVSTETLRGLGYWLFYIRDPYAFTTTASLDYMSSSLVIVAGYALTAVCLAGLAVVRWGQRRYAAWMVVAGIVLAVGVHPITDPSPLMKPLADSALGLALRSSTRALPLSTFGLALGAGALVTAIATTRFRVRLLAAPLVVLLAVVNLPALWTGGFVDPALERDQDPPAAWLDAVGDLDAGSSEYRVLQLPGSEFGAFRWGYTVDPPLPGLNDKPLVTRDLLPLGSPGAMDLLYALDNRFQAGTIDPAAIAPIARLLGADTIWVADDLAFDRFRTPRPEVVADLFAATPPGLGTPTAFGEPTPNVPDVPMVDEQQLGDPRVGTALPTVELVPVREPVPIVRTATRVVLVAGSGDGLVDAAAAGLLQGDELVRYAADLGPDDLAQAVAAADSGGAGLSTVVVTDSNRDRATHWRGSQDVSGLTETGGPESDVTRFTSADQRLAVFATQTPSNQTVALLDDGTSALGTLRVRATAYGEPFAYRPEDRPAMAVDGNPATAWVVADRFSPEGESIELSATDGALRLVQPQDPTATRVITRVRVDEVDGTSREVALDESSLRPPGQTVELGSTGPVSVTIVSVADRAEGTDSGPSAVGFAELGPVATEVTVLPSDLLDRIDADTRLAIVLSRERTRPSDRWRDDPEPAMVRQFALPVDRTFDAAVTLRLDARATDAVLADLAGRAPVATASSHLTGMVSAGAAAAVDGNPATAWVTPFGQAVGSTLTLALQPGTTTDRFELVQPTDGLHSTVTTLNLVAGDLDVTVPVPAPDATGLSTVVLPTAVPADADQVTLTITGVESRTTIDRRYGEMTELPAAIGDISGFALAADDPVERPVGCRNDLVVVDGTPLGLDITDDVLDRLLAGEAVDVAPCDDAPFALTSGTHRIVTGGGVDAASTTGIDVDRITLRSSYFWQDNLPAAPVVQVERTRTTRTATVGPCPEGCWLVLGEGYNDAWTASVQADGIDTSLGTPEQVSGGFNGWYLAPSDQAHTVTMTWTPQSSLNIALLIASLGVLACLALALVDRRSARPIDEFDPPAWCPIGKRASTIDAATAAVALVVAAALAIDPNWAVIALVPAAAVVVTRRPRLAAWAAAALAAALGAGVLLEQRRHRYFPDAAWPSNFEQFHQAGLFVVVLLFAATLGSDERADGRHRRIRVRRRTGSSDQGDTAALTSEAARNESLTQ
jgi:arabinofuranan 3-O-arabinosyltransferase